MEKGLKERAALWKFKADNDLKIVEMTINHAFSVTDILAFHCQQAAEKYLKMFLVLHGVEPKRTHDIGFLVGECCRIETAFEELYEVAFLTIYAVETRYVDEFFMPSLEELQNAYTAAIRVRDFVVARVKE